MTQELPIVFISSTVEDLREYRQKAKQIAIQSGFFVMMSEDFPATGQPSLEQCLQQVNKCDLVVVIVAHKYGHKPTDHPGCGKKSITQIECEQAKSNGKDVLPFLIDENYSAWPKEMREGYRVTIAIEESKDTPELINDVKQSFAGLKAFKEELSKTIRATFRTVEDFGDKLWYALAEWQKKNSDKFKKSESALVDHSDQITRYCDLLKKELSEIKLLGSSEISNVPANLLDVFVPLWVSETDRTESQYDSDFAGKETAYGKDQDLSPEEVIQRAFKDKRLLLIIGESGSGKTTLLAYFGIQCLNENGYATLGFKQPPLPLFLALREVTFIEKKPCSLPMCFAKWAKDRKKEIPETAFETWLNSDETLVLLDGLDEVSDIEKRRAICRWIDSLHERFKKARFVVTSRWTGYRKDENIEITAGHLRADVKALTLKQQSDFLKKWFLATLCQEPVPVGTNEKSWKKESEQKAKDKADEIINYLHHTENKGLSEAAREPLLLQIMALIWKDREYLPETRFDLFNAAFKYLVEEREKQRRLTPVISGREAYHILCPLSLQMQREKTDCIQKNKAHAEAAIICKRIALKNIPSMDAVFRYLCDRTAMLISNKNDVYLFRHKIFREFLAAKQFVEECWLPRNINKIVVYLGDDWWEETLRFIFCNATMEQFDFFMEAIFRSRQSRELDQKIQNQLSDLVSRTSARKIDALKSCLFDDRLNEGNRRRYILDLLKEIGNDEAIACVREFVSRNKATATDLARAREILAYHCITFENSYEPKIPAKTFRRHTKSQRNPASVWNSFELNAEYILIPGGSYQYSVSRMKIDVPDIYFAKYPVTNARYRRFIAYLKGETPELRDQLAKDDYLAAIQEMIKSAPGLGDYQEIDLSAIFCSRFDSEKRFNSDDQPVVGIIWYAAKAYCLWLTQLHNANGPRRSKQEIRTAYRLPFEYEWEWAAGGRNIDKSIRPYPWPNEKGAPRPEFANYDRKVGTTTPVGRFPDGATPEGLMDMAGNIWEWMEDRSDKVVDGYTLRGGSWNNDASFLHCSDRGRNHALYPDSIIGFRVVRTIDL